MCSSLREGRSQHNHRYGTEKQSSTVSVFKSNQPSNFWPQEKIWNLSTTNKKIIFAFKNVINLSLITHCVFLYKCAKMLELLFHFGSHVGATRVVQKYYSDELQFMILQMTGMKRRKQIGKNKIWQTQCWTLSLVTAFNRRSLYSDSACTTADISTWETFAVGSDKGL